MQLTPVECHANPFKNDVPKGVSGLLKKTSTFCLNFVVRMCFRMSKSAFVCQIVPNKNTFESHGSTNDTPFYNSAKINTILNLQLEVGSLLYTSKGVIPLDC